MKIVCQTLEIESQRLTKSKLIQRFDDKAAQPVIYAIYPIFSMENHFKSLSPLLITKLDYHFMIFSCL